MSSVVCTLASLSPGTVLDEVLRFEVWALRTPVERRVKYFPGIEDGIVQDFGISEADRKITGQVYASKTTGDKINDMYLSSTTYWLFSDGVNLWKVYFLNFEKVEPFGNKILYDIELGVKEKFTVDNN
jgi:hypothetical protein